MILSFLDKKTIENTCRRIHIDENGNLDANENHLIKSRSVVISFDPSIKEKQNELLMGNR